MMQPHRILPALCAAWCGVFLACSDAATSPDAGLAPSPDAGRSDGGDAGETPLEQSGSIYDPERVLEVELTATDADWELIRAEGRSLNDVLASCDDPDFTYTEVAASAVIDGDDLPGVGLRKKGFLGSLSTVRPSLRIDFAESDPQARFRGLKGLTLNNNRQDLARVRQCLAYGVFARAGVPAPRCTFAHVTVNGEDLGIYTNVERVGKPLLARYFESDEGDLFEGNPGADFREDKLQFLEKKTNEDDPGRAPLIALAEALVEADESALDAVEALVDVDAFLTFWAVESLISHWDGYAGDLNNYFVYVDPATEKLVFLPWGTDGAFDRNHGFLPEIGRPVSVLAMARLPQRLYAWPSTRERYRRALQDVLDTVWDEDELLAEIDRMAGLIGGAADDTALAELRAFIRTRRDEVQAELDADAPEWTFAERAPRLCRDESIDVSGTFEVAWSDLDMPIPNASNTLDAPLEGIGDSFANMLGAAGPYDAEASLRGPSIRIATFLPDGTGLLVQMSIGPRALEPGTYPFHGLEASGFIARGTNEQNVDVLGFFGDGEIVIEQGSMEPGATVRGRFNGRMSPADFL